MILARFGFPQGQRPFTFIRERGALAISVSFFPSLGQRHSYMARPRLPDCGTVFFAKNGNMNNYGPMDSTIQLI
jgi:hypothetical protein